MLPLQRPRPYGLVTTTYQMPRRRTSGLPFIVADRSNEAAAVAEARRCAAKGAKGVGEMAWYAVPLRRSRAEMHGGSRWIPGRGGHGLHDAPERAGSATTTRGKGGRISARLSASCRVIPALTCFWPIWAGHLLLRAYARDKEILFPRLLRPAAVPFLYSDALYRYAAAFLEDKVIFGSDYPPPQAQPLQAGNRRPRQRRAEKIASGNGVRLLGN